MSVRPNHPSRTPRRTRIIISGVRTLEDALAAADAGADAVGFSFEPAGPRAISPEDAYDIMARLPPLVGTVGAFADAGIDEFSDVEEVCPTTHSLLRGAESDKLVRSCGPGVIKAVRFDPDSTPADLARFDAIEEVDAIQIEPAPGQPVDWRALASMLLGVEKPIVLGGPFTPAGVGEAISIVRPWAVDAAMADPPNPGLMGMPDVAELCDAVRRADARSDGPTRG